MSETTPRRSRADGTTALEDIDLDTVGLMTVMIREHQEGIARLAVKRRAKVLALKEAGFTYVRIAEACGLSENAVYKIVREPDKEILPE